MPISSDRDGHRRSRDNERSARHGDAVETAIVPQKT
jgi:hypothetical protein